ncbi:U3 small nucleolar ribonucleoprotein IMP4-like [Petromyzon marinus]|uniref:U3 small nucleolar ribonucleoprotein IMP4-like n=1 Tax=Petromyzon marinus TaxID=7757 RepID=UPI003F70C841
MSTARGDAARHLDVDMMSEAFQHLVMHNFTSRLGKRAQRLQVRRQGHRVEGVYEIKLGTLDNAATAEVEWPWRPYMNTAKKRKFLSVE